MERVLLTWIRPVWSGRAGCPPVPDRPYSSPYAVMSPVAVIGAGAPWDAWPPPCASTRSA
jgi:hypothetical protein